jgi:hypothetical protein
MVDGVPRLHSGPGRGDRRSICMCLGKGLVCMTRLPAQAALVNRLRSTAVLRPGGQEGRAASVRVHCNRTGGRLGPMTRRGGAEGTGTLLARILERMRPSSGREACA